MNLRDTYIPALVSETLLHEMNANATMARVCVQAIQSIVGDDMADVLLCRERSRATSLILELPYVDATAPVSCRRLPLEMALLEHAEREAS